MPPVKELPVEGSRFIARGPAMPNRRQALSLLATGIASGLAACSKPVEEIIPYVKMPERVVPGEPLKFATTLSLSGLAAASSSPRSMDARSKSRAIHDIRRALAQLTSSQKPRSCRCTTPTAHAPFSKKAT